MWLKLATTNRDPLVISRYYLESVEKIKGTYCHLQAIFSVFAHYLASHLISLLGCPRIIRADHGTENCTVAKIHIAFRMDHADSLAGSKSFIYGRSTSNIVGFAFAYMNAFYI